MRVSFHSEAFREVEDAQAWYEERSVLAASAFLHEVSFALDETVDIFREADTMSRMGSRKAGRRPRRQFSEEFKAGAVRLVIEEGKTVGAVARELDLTGSALAGWVRQAERDTGQRPGLTTSERERLATLERENRELKRTNEILKTASALFAQAALDRRIK